MKIYISGAISGTDDYRERFEESEDFLEGKGHAVINPVKNDGFEYKEYMLMAITELLQCDAVYMLDGWENSKGACLEKMAAEVVGMKIFYEIDGFCE